MTIVNGLKDFASEPNFARLRPRVVLTLGNFDGVHLGHQALIKRVQAIAKQTQSQTAVFTFEPHPSKVLRAMGAITGPEIPRILDLQDFTRVLAEYQIDWLIIEPFNEQFAKLRPEEFLNLLAAHVDLAGVVVGYDFAFGKDRSGTFQTLQEWAKNRKRYGHGEVLVEQLEPLLKDGEIVSSSRIRESLRTGDVEKACVFLSRPYFICGHVVPGEGRGKTLGFRTANIQTDAELLPKNGVYITRLYSEHDGEIISSSDGLPSVTNIGRKPTFHDSYAVTVECHVLERPLNVEGRRVCLEFLKRLRDELKFESAHALMEQIAHDVHAARTFFELQNV